MAYPTTLDTIADGSLGREKIDKPNSVVQSLDWDVPASELNALKSAVVALETEVGTTTPAAGSVRYRLGALEDADARAELETTRKGIILPDNTQLASSTPTAVSASTALVRVTRNGTTTLDVSALAVGQMIRVVKANAGASAIYVQGDVDDQINGGTAGAAMKLPNSEQSLTTTLSDPDWWVYRVDGTTIRVFGSPFGSAMPTQLTATAASQGLWLFSGSLSDSSGNARTLGGFSAPPYLTRLGVGQYGQRAIMAGGYTNTDTWASIAASSKTVEAVIRTRANGTADQVLLFVGKNLGAAADTMWLFYVAANGQLTFEYYSSGPTLRSLGSDAIVPGGHLCHVAATMSVSGSDVTVKLYINGQISGSTTFTSAAPVTVSSSQLYALDNPATDSPFTDTVNGAEIHGLHITNDVMSDATIAARALAVLGAG